jgi:hypothetical protein
MNECQRKCASIREIRQMSKVDAGGETAISGCSDIIKSKELE